MEQSISCIITLQQCGYFKKKIRLTSRIGDTNKLFQLLPLVSHSLWWVVCWVKLLLIFSLRCMSKYSQFTISWKGSKCERTTTPLYIVWLAMLFAEFFGTSCNLTLNMDRISSTAIICVTLLSVFLMPAWSFRNPVYMFHNRVSNDDTNRFVNCGMHKLLLATLLTCYTA